MLPRFDEKRLHGELKCLGSQMQLAFGALCSERLLPNYEVFSAETGHGDSSVLRNALELVWDKALHPALETRCCERLMSHVSPKLQAPKLMNR